MATPTAPRFEPIEGWQQLPKGYSQPDAVGVGVDSRDRVYVFTRGADARVMVFDQDGSFITSWGEGLFGSHTHSLYIGPNDSVYCTVDGDHVIHKFTPEGKLLMTLGTRGVAPDTGYDPSKGPGSIRGGFPPFNRPTNICVAPNGELYVSDGYGNARVHRFTADGRLIQSWGEPGTGPGQFNTVHDVRVTADGRVLVADRENERIQVFSPDGEFIEQWTDLQRPTGLCLGPDGLVYVAELWWWPSMRSSVRGVIEKFEPGQLSVLDTDGKVLTRLGGKPDCCAPGNFAVPHSIAFDSRGDMYVGEVIYSMGVSLGRLPEGCHTLQKFARK